MFHFFHLYLNLILTVSSERILRLNKYRIWNVAHFVIILCCVFLIGNLLHSFKFVVLYIFKDDTASFANEYSLVADTLLYFSQSLNLFLYYNFNICFRRMFRRIFYGS